VKLRSRSKTKNSPYDLRLCGKDAKLLKWKYKSLHILEELFSAFFFLFSFATLDQGGEFFSHRVAARIAIHSHNV
jgi:hypothetical protein